MQHKTFLLSLALIIATASMAVPSDEAGRVIFSNRCTSCHNINKTLIGPALSGVEQRHSIDWIIRFVQSSQNVIKSGDKDANALYSRYNNIAMPDHTDLSAEHIKSVVSYIKSQSKNIAAEKAPFARPGKLRPGYTPLLFSNYAFIATYFAVVALIIFALLLMVRVKEYERNGVWK